MTTANKKRLRNAVIAIVILVMLAQLIQNNSNNGEAASPNDITHAVTVPTTVLQTLQTSCYDCHSNHTNYPWYAHIQPTGWWLNDHIDDGKRALNFSEFNTYTMKRKSKKLEDIAEVIEKGEMPLDSYLWIHRDAKLTKAQADELINWAKTTKAK